MGLERPFLSLYVIRENNSRIKNKTEKWENKSMINVAKTLAEVIK